QNAPPSLPPPSPRVRQKPSSPLKPQIPPADGFQQREYPGDNRRLPSLQALPTFLARTTSTEGSFHAMAKVSRCWPVDVSRGNRFRPGTNGSGKHRATSPVYPSSANGTCLPPVLAR